MQIYSNWWNFSISEDKVFNAYKPSNANIFWLEQFYISDKYTFQSRLTIKCKIILTSQISALLMYKVFNAYKPSNANLFWLEQFYISDRHTFKADKPSNANLFWLEQFYASDRRTF